MNPNTDQLNQMKIAICKALNLLKRRDSYGQTWKWVKEDGVSTMPFDEAVDTIVQDMEEAIIEETQRPATFDEVLAAIPVSIFHKDPPMQSASPYPQLPITHKDFYISASKVPSDLHPQGTAPPMNIVGPTPHNFKFPDFRWNKPSPGTTINPEPDESKPPEGSSLSEWINKMQEEFTRLMSPRTPPPVDTTSFRNERWRTKSTDPADATMNVQVQPNNLILKIDTMIVECKVKADGANYDTTIWMDGLEPFLQSLTIHMSDDKAPAIHAKLLPGGKTHPCFTTSRMIIPNQDSVRTKDLTNRLLDTANILFGNRVQKLFQPK